MQFDPGLYLVYFHKLHFLDKQDMRGGLPLTVVLQIYNHDLPTFNSSCLKHDALAFCGYIRGFHTVSVCKFWSAYHLTSSCVAFPNDQDELLAAGLRVPVDPHRRRTSFLLLSCNQTLSHYVNPDSNPIEFETVNPFFRRRLTNHSDCRSSLFLPKWANGNYTDLRINTYCAGKCWT